MALGCAFIFIIIIMLWRRRARKQRAKQTAMFANAKRLDGGNGWRWRLENLRRRLFGKKKNAEVLPMAYRDDGDRYDSLAVPPHLRSLKRDIKPDKLHDVEIRKDTADDYDNFIGHYEHSRSSRTPSTLSSIDDHYNPRRIERDSWYSQATGNQRLTPEPRQPLKRDASGASKLVKTPVLVNLEEEKGGGSLPTKAQTYAMSVHPGLITASTNTASSQPPAVPSSFIRTTTPVALTPTPPLIGQKQVQGPFWLSPIVNTHPIGGSQQQFHLLDNPSTSSVDAVVLQPMNTGGSSRNPFRQGAF